MMDVLHVYDINKILFDNVWVRGLLFWTGINKEQEVRDIYPSRLRSFKAEQLLWHFGGIQQRPDCQSSRVAARACLWIARNATS